MKIIITEEQYNKLTDRKCPEKQYFDGKKCVNFPVGTKYVKVKTQKEFDKMMKTAQIQAFFYERYLRLLKVDKKDVFGFSDSWDSLLKKFNKTWLDQPSLAFHMGMVDVKNNKLLKDKSSVGEIYNRFYDRNLKYSYFIVRQSDTPLGERQSYYGVEVVTTPPRVPVMEDEKPSPIATNKTKLSNKKEPIKNTEKKVTEPSKKISSPTQFTVTWREDLPSGKVEQNTHYFNTYDDWKRFTDQFDKYVSKNENKSKTSAEALYSGKLNLSKDKTY